MPQPPSSPLALLALVCGVSRSFYLSIRVLPGPMRRPVALAYLLARACDTLADTTVLPASERKTMLTVLAAAIGGEGLATDLPGLVTSFEPFQTDPAERALIAALPQCLVWLGQIPEADRSDIRTVLGHIARGQSLDLDRFHPALPPRALATAAELDDYTYLVAGCVGEFWTELGFRHLPEFSRLPRQEMRELGRAYGVGLQLVNILRDAGPDLRDGRCYFPGDELAAEGTSPAHLLANPGPFEAVWQRWHDEAQRKLELGMRYADAVNVRRVRAASALPALLGARTLALLRQAGPQLLEHKVKVPRGEVRSIISQLAFTLAGRAPLQAQFGRLRAGATDRGWDNQRP